jgi:hypothetical protein
LNFRAVLVIKFVGKGVEFCVGPAVLAAAYAVKREDKIAGVACGGLFALGMAGFNKKKNDEKREK